MPINNVLRRLAQINSVVEGWEGLSAVSEIEKDILLDKLRELYAQVKSMDCTDEGVAVPPAVEAEPEVADEPKAEYTNTEDSCGVPAEKTPEPQKEEVAPAEEPVYEDVAAAFIVEEFGKSNASDDEKAKKRKAIMSLYDDGGSSEAEESAQPASETDTEEDAPAPIAIVEQSVVVEQTIEEYRKETHVTQETQTVVIGDVLGAGERTIADSYVANGSADVASKISSSNVTELRTAIGINDKFLMIRDLFDGDTDAYNDAITRLDGFDSLGEALLFIHENYNWNPNSEGAVLLMDLLSRKLS